MLSNVDWGALATIGVFVLSGIQGWALMRAQQNERRHRQHETAVEAIRQDIQSRDLALVEKLGAINLLVQGKYLTRDEFNSSMASQTRAFTEAIARVEQKMENAMFRRLEGGS
jgi:hypothetical protein